MALVGCSQGDAQEEVRIAPKELPIATLIIKDYGTIEADLYPHIAPNTVNNFISLANKDFYNFYLFYHHQYDLL